ncbi:MAG: hypothetical protein IJO98_00290 [Clostridia bacterium]|nr:hypothetical protein [Clostridia bacterium]
MNLEVDPKGIWYHGSNARFDVLREGSTITQWRELAEAFSHKPTMLGIEDDGSIRHNGAEKGFLYAVDEPVEAGVDVYPHPRTTMDENAEWITGRDLKMRLIGEIKA